MKYNGLISYFTVQFYFLFTYFLISFISHCGTTVFSNSLQICLEHCVDRNLAIPLASGSLRWRSAAFLECDYQCHIDSCQIGCKDLEQLDSTCDNRCSSTKAIDSCFQGCYAVSNIFLHQIQYLLNHVTVDSKLDPLRGITLSWTFGESFGITLQEISAANIQWHAQTRSHQTLLKSGSGWKWTEFPPGSFKESSTNVSVVVPLEEIPDIEIRLAAIWRDKTIVSQTFFQTIPGIPVKSKTPQLLTNMQISSDQFLLCWQSDPPTAGGNYNIELKNASDDTVIESIETKSQCHLFRSNISKSDEYPINFKVHIWDKMDDMGDGKDTVLEGKAKLEVNVTLERREDKPETENVTFIFTNGTSILKMADLNDFLMLGDLEIIPFTLNENQKISALATVSHDQLVVGLSDGSIYSLKVLPPPPMDDETIIDLAFNGTENNITPKYKTEQSLIRESDGIEIIQVVVDGVQERIYAVRNQSGLIRCSFNNCANATVLTTNSISFIDRIAVDYWNGFLYYSMANGDVFIATLFPWDAPSTYSFNIQRRIAQIPQIYSMEIDYNNQQLIAALRNGTLISMNLINQNVTNLRPGLIETEKYSSVKKQKFINERLFWISSDCGDDHEWKSCLYGEEKDPETGVIHLNRYLYPGPVNDIAVLQDLPKPSYLMPPEKVSLIISGKEAKATWLPPISLPFQASGTSWRNLKYDFKLIESSTSTVLDHSQTSETEAFLNAKISKATNYTIFVKVCVEKSLGDSFYHCSKFVSTSVMTPGLFSTIPTFPSVIAYIPERDEEDGSLKMIDILGRDFNNSDESFPSIPSNPPDVISFDNATKAIYFADASDISIFRSMSPTTIRYRFLDFLTITHLSIIPSKAVIVFSSAYQIVQYRLTGTFDRMVYQCGQQDCAEVVAVTSCDNDSKIYYLLQSPNGNISLYEFQIDNFVSVQISSAKQFPKIKQLIYTENEFTFVTFDGQLGTFDTNLQNIQINFGIKNVKHLLPYIPIESKAVEFMDEKN